jgi:glycosyltransferase involved in cell wall biosynthesis
VPLPRGSGRGQRLKYEQYFDDWRSAGYDIDVSPFMDMALWKVVYESGHYPEKVLGTLRGHLRRMRDVFRIHRYDVVYVTMWVTPLGSSVFERLTRLLAKSLIFDVEDNILIEQGIPKEEDPNRRLRWLKGRGKARFLIRRADHVITSSPFLNDFCLAINERRQCTYISSSVDADRFLPANRFTNDGVVTVGWTGTYSSKVYLDMLRGVFRELAQRVPFRLKVIGNFDYELDGVDLEVVRWTSEREVQDLQTFDIGVYPLPIDDWVLGKSGLKAIQYMMFGLPAVATNVGTTPMIIDHDVNGILVESDSDWLNALERLIRDPALRKRLGDAARIKAEQNYSTRAVASMYRKVLATLEESKP